MTVQRRELPDPSPDYLPRFIKHIHRESPLGNKMKKLFVVPKRMGKQTSLQEQTVEESAVGHTLDRIINAKEEARRAWEAEQDAFRRRGVAHEQRMLAMEEAEAARREQEVRARGESLDDIKRKNRIVQEKVAEQIAHLQMKLDEYKLAHKAEEEALEDEIATMEDTLVEVKQSLEMRKKALEMATMSPSAPPADHADGHGSVTGSAPSLTALDHDTDTECSLRDRGRRMYPMLQPRGGLASDQHQHQGHPVPSTRSLHAAIDSALSKANFLTSSGSSPQTSHASSSRSATPKTDSDTSV